MSGFIVKLIVCPAAIILASWIFPNVHFALWYQPIVIGAVLAVIGYYMEVGMLNSKTNWVSTMMDFIVSTLVVYFGSMLFIGANVTFWGAVLTGIIIGITEIVQHYWLLGSGRVDKEDPVGDRT